MRGTVCLLGYDTVRYDAVRYDAVRYDAVRYDVNGLISHSNLLITSSDLIYPNAGGTGNV